MGIKFIEMLNFFTISRFNKTARFLPALAVASGLLLPAALYLALFASPPDYQQGEAVRIMYIHVPSAWMALFVYSVMAASSASGLIWKNPLSYIMAKESAPIGACFTAITLITGSLWGKPMWGAYWVWDARLTSVLILFFLYIGFMLMFSAFDSRERAEKSAGVLAIMGFINIPIIKFSVDWWNTLHQPASIIRIGGPAIHSSMLWPLLIMFAGFVFLFITLLIIRMQAEILGRKTTRQYQKT